MSWETWRQSTTPIPESGEFKYFVFGRRGERIKHFLLRGEEEVKSSVLKVESGSYFFLEVAKEVKYFVLGEVEGGKYFHLG